MVDTLKLQQGGGSCATLASQLSPFEPGFAVFQYLTLRSILGVLTALITALFVGPAIRSLENRQIGQSVRRDGPETFFEAGDSHNGSANSRLYHCFNASMG